MTTSDRVVAPEETVTSQLIREAQQYRTVQTLQKWPIVTNGSTAALDGYHMLKKEGDVTRVVLNVSEEVASAVCRLAVLPAVQSPLLKTPLRMADWVGASGAGLLQKAIPKLTDTKQPLRPNAELLLSLLLVPLTLSVALSRDLLQLGVDALISTFPGLEPAAKGFADKSLAAQVGTALLMLWVYLPLQFLARPVQTVTALVSVPGRVFNIVATWVREVYETVMDEVTMWTSTVSDYFVQVISWVAATAQTAYYVVFEMTGLGPLLAALLKRVRDLFSTAAATVSAPGAGLTERVAVWEMAPVRWVRELWCGAGDSQRAEGEQLAAIYPSGSGSTASY